MDGSAGLVVEHGTRGGNGGSLEEGEDVRRSCKHSLKKAVDSSGQSGHESVLWQPGGGLLPVQVECLEENVRGLGTVCDMLASTRVHRTQCVTLTLEGWADQDLYWGQLSSLQVLEL